MVKTRHLAGLERLNRPAREGKVVSCRVPVELIVPAAGRRLVLDDAIEALVRSLLAVRVLRHAVRLAERVGRDEEAVFVSVRPCEVRHVVRASVDAADQVVERHLHGGPKVALVRRRDSWIFAGREIRKNRKARVRDLVRSPPAAVGVLVRLEPPEDLHDRRLGVRITTAAVAPARRYADRSWGAASVYAFKSHG